jgi:hypothetical protein
MKRFNVEATNNHPHFIGSWIIEPLSLCDDIIEFFEGNKSLQKHGTTGSQVNRDVKNSMDISISPRDVKLATHISIQKYISCLYDCYTDYVTTWPFLKSMASQLDIGSFNIQRYLEGEHFQQVHSERMGLINSHRLFAWMTYLNTVEDGGSTSFTHYGLEIKPKRGRTLIWPADWTHAHCGNIIKSGRKYVITGWLHFPPTM